MTLDVFLLDFADFLQKDYAHDPTSQKMTLAVSAGLRSEQKAT
jgi:hypothetical protein